MNKKAFWKDSPVIVRGETKKMYKIEVDGKLKNVLKDTVEFAQEKSETPDEYNTYKRLAEIQKRGKKEVPFNRLNWASIVEQPIKNYLVKGRPYCVVFLSYQEITPPAGSRHKPFTQVVFRDVANGNVFALGGHQILNTFKEEIPGNYYNLRYVSDRDVKQPEPMKVYEIVSVDEELYTELDALLKDVVKVGTFDFEAPQIPKDDTPF